MAQCYGSQELLPLVLLTKPPQRPERTTEIVQRRDTGSNRGVAGHPQGQKKKRGKAKKRGRGKKEEPSSVSASVLETTWSLHPSSCLTQLRSGEAELAFGCFYLGFCLRSIDGDRGLFRSLLCTSTCALLGKHKCPARPFFRRKKKKIWILCSYSGGCA